MKPTKSPELGPVPLSLSHRVWRIPAWPRPLIKLIWLIGILGTLQIAGSLLPARVDLTQSQQSSLSPRSQQILRQLTAPIEIIVISPTEGRSATEQAFSQATGPLTHLVEKCQAVANRQLTLTRLDPDRDHRAKLLMETVPQFVAPGVMIQREFDQRVQTETLSLADLAEVRRRSNGTVEMVFRGEQSLLATLERLENGSTKQTIYLLTGHGELSQHRADASSRQGCQRLVEHTSRCGYDVKELNLAAEGRVPAAADLVVILSPVSDLNPAEVSFLRRYAIQGGRFLIAMELTDAPLKESLPHWDEFLGELEVTVGHDPLVTIGFSGAAELASPVMPGTSQHPLVERLPLVPIVVQNGVSVRSRVTLDPATTTVTPVLVSTAAPRAWCETNSAQSPAVFDPDEDLGGPVSVAVVVERNEGSNQEPLAVVIGDSEFLNDNSLSRRDSVVRAVNSFFVSSCHWLTGRQQWLSDIPVDIKRAYELPTEPHVLQRTIWITGCLGMAFAFSGTVTTWIQRRR